MQTNFEPRKFSAYCEKQCCGSWMIPDPDSLIFHSGSRIRIPKVFIPDPGFYCTGT
jgi:hypothetical protein